MILNEDKLAAAMKTAYKGPGYHAVRYTDQSGRQMLGVYGDGWYVAMEHSNVPRKVLGLLAEHAGLLPEEDEAWVLRVPATEGMKLAMEHLGRMQWT